MGISDEELSKKLNNILGLNETERILFYSQIIQNNYFNDSKTEIKISNGGFYNSDIVKVILEFCFIHFQTLCYIYSLTSLH